ncbi:MAG TPA: serine hydrolase domain-containing protein [Microthrixaceae bacterium]|nr:serine hydrolase domain-containing protein [Microthrixaceae bacterium]HMT25144.1 serine hydrolase domain-containing protein [Microthrixaceae bacterium]HMT60497.1 serine hydrolase domain-containing protein [Microthrixaceae bacterium]
MDPIPATLEATIRARLRERHTQGLALACFDAGGIRFAGSVGDADLTRGEPVTPQTVFRVASISKLLTTTLALTAVDAGLIDLDEPVNRYLPVGLRITTADGAPAMSRVRTLLSHTSGLPAGARGADLGNAALTRIANAAPLRSLADSISGLQLVRRPGERVIYSNVGFNVAGYIAGRAFGQPFEEAARAHVLEPLGMIDAAFTPHRVGPGVATPYGSIVPPRVGAKPADRVRLVATPMGGLTTSVLDLARFGRMVLNGGEHGGRPIVSARLLDAATTMTARNHPELEQGYGLGFKVRTWRGRTVIGHDGNMPGVATQLWLAPDDGLGVVVLTNGYALAVPHEIAATALEHALGLPPVPAPDPPAHVRAWEHFGRRVEGRYELQDSQIAGLAGRVANLLAKVRVRHESAGRLRLEGNPGSDGPVLLWPDGELGHYRVDGYVDPGANAFIEEQPDGPHLWLTHATHLLRK